MKIKLCEFLAAIAVASGILYSMFAGVSLAQEEYFYFLAYGALAIINGLAAQGMKQTVIRLKGDEDVKNRQ